MDEHSGQQRWAIGQGGRKYLELPAGRAPLPEPHETEWDRVAQQHRRKVRADIRAEAMKPLLDNSPIRPVPSTPR